MGREGIGRDKVAWKGYLAKARASLSYLKEAGPLEWQVWLYFSHFSKSESFGTGNKLFSILASILSLCNLE